MNSATLSYKHDELYSELVNLKKIAPNFQLKAEFEGEGSMFADVASLTQLSKSCRVPINIKLAGAEALRDLYELSYLGVNGVIAPMIESPFAVVKFREAVKRVQKIHNFDKVSVLVESKVGLQNLPQIVSEFDDTINSLIIGRGDLRASLINSEDYSHSIDSDNFTEFITDSLSSFANSGFKIGMGGKLSIKTLDMLTKHSRLADLLDFIETRKIVLPTKLVLAQPSLLKAAIKVEKLYINRKMNYYNSMLNDEATRALLLESRLEASE